VNQFHYQSPGRGKDLDELNRALEKTVKEFDEKSKCRYCGRSLLVRKPVDLNSPLRLKVLDKCPRCGLTDQLPTEGK
jgi:hypothetical protein